MKNKALALTVLIILFVGVCSFYFYSQGRVEPGLVVRSMGDNKGIFVGDKSKAMIEQEEHNQALRAIDQASSFEREGDQYFKLAQYEEAVEAYKKSYSIKGGLSEATSGLLLVQTYEKLGRYDEGITLLDQMIEKHQLSQKGIQNANEIKVRLLTAKAAQEKQGGGQ